MRKVAIYKDVKYGSELVREVSEWIEESSQYIRTSEIVEIDPPPISRDVVVAQEVAALEQAIAEIEAKAYDATANIKAKIRDLQVICHEVQP